MKERERLWRVLLKNIADITVFETDLFLIMDWSMSPTFVLSKKFHPSYRNQTDKHKQHTYTNLKKISKDKANMKN